MILYSRKLIFLTWLLTFQRRLIDKLAPHLTLEEDTPRLTRILSQILKHRADDLETTGIFRDAADQKLIFLIQSRKMLSSSFALDAIIQNETMLFSNYCLIIPKYLIYFADQ